MKMDKLKILSAAKIIKSHFLDEYIGRLPIELQRIIYMHTLIIVRHPICDIMRNHINKNDFISRFNLHVPLKLCNRYLCNNIYYRYLDIDDMHILNTLMSKKYINKKDLRKMCKYTNAEYDKDDSINKLFKKCFTKEQRKMYHKGLREHNDEFVYKKRSS